MRGRERKRDRKRERERERNRERISAMTAKQGLAGSLRETISVCSESLFHTLLTQKNIASDNCQQKHILRTSTQIKTHIKETEDKATKMQEVQLPSVFCSPKAVSKGGPNKAVVSSETGVS